MFIETSLITSDFIIIFLIKSLTEKFNDGTIFKRGTLGYFDQIWREVRKMTANDFKIAKKVIGIKQVTKALDSDKVNLLVVASDAEAKLLQPLLELSEKKSVVVERIDSMQELGRLCGIQVGAAAVAFLQD